MLFLWKTCTWATCPPHGAILVVQIPRYFLLFSYMYGTKPCFSCGKLTLGRPGPPVDDTGGQNYAANCHTNGGDPRSDSYRRPPGGPFSLAISIMKCTKPCFSDGKLTLGRPGPPVGDTGCPNYATNRHTNGGYPRLCCFRTQFCSPRGHF